MTEEIRSEILAMDISGRLANARELIRTGHAKQACAILRPLLEQYLREVCIRDGIESARLTIGSMVKALYERGQIDSGERLRLLSWNTFGNIGSHATRDAVSAADAEYFLNGIAERLGIPASDRSRASIRIGVSKNRSRRGPNDKLSYEQRRNTLIAGLYLSQFGHEHLQMGNQDETLAAVAARLGVKKNTLKNYRDKFDPHTGSGRRGWWQKDLSSDERGILNEFKRHTELELRKLVQSFNAKVR